MSRSSGLDFLTLSGGDKTSVALAYMLALNTMVKKVAIGETTNVLSLTSRPKDSAMNNFSKSETFSLSSNIGFQNTWFLPSCPVSELGAFVPALFFETTVGFSTRSLLIDDKTLTSHKQSRNMTPNVDLSRNVAR